MITPEGFHPALARIRYISGRSCDRPSGSKMFTTDVDPTTNADIEPKMFRSTAIFTRRSIGIDIKVLLQCSLSKDEIKSIYYKTQFTSRQHNSNINYNSISINTQLICYMFRLFLSHHQAHTSRTTVFQFLSYSSS